MPKFGRSFKHTSTTHYKNKNKKKVHFHCVGGGVSTTECEILPCKPGGNTGDIAISSPCMLGFFFFPDFPCISNVTKLCTKVGGRKSRITPEIVRFVVLRLN